MFLLAAAAGVDFMTGLLAVFEDPFFMMDPLAMIAGVFCRLWPRPSEGDASLLADRPREEDLAPLLPRTALGFLGPRLTMEHLAFCL
jgi:hypothetical protein